MDGQTVDGEARRSVVSTEAAGLRLGIKADSIRARLRRGSLEGYQDAAGVWWIFADQLQGGVVGNFDRDKLVPDLGDLAQLADAFAQVVLHQHR